MSSVSRTVIAARAAAAVGCGEDVALAVVIAALDAIGGALADGDTVRLANIGRLKPVPRGANSTSRDGDGQLLLMPDRVIVRLLVAPALRARVNGGVLPEGKPVTAPAPTRPFLGPVPQPRGAR